MLRKTDIEEKHPLRKLFRQAIEFGLKVNPCEYIEAADYIEDQILCGFMHADNMYRIKNTTGRSLDDIADMLEEGNVLLNANSFEREFEVHKHIGDYTLFMLSMFPSALNRKRGKEFILGKIVIPGASLSEHYVIQGKRSYGIAAEFTHAELFTELSVNFLLYQSILELVRIYLESIGNEDYNRIRRIIEGSA